MNNLNINRQHFYNAIRESYIKYLTQGSRSPEKLKPIHSWIGKTYQNILGEEYDVSYLNGSEITIEGRYYPKRVDIAVFKNETVQFVVSFKFVTSNYKQNVNNFFENLLGECANIKSQEIGFGHIVVMRNKIPYYERGGVIKRWEVPNDHDLGKYVKLYGDKEKYFHAPNFLCIEIVSMNNIIEESFMVGPGSGGYKINRNLNSLLSDLQVVNGIKNTDLVRFKKFINENMNIIKFFQETSKYIKSKR